MSYRYSVKPSLFHQQYSVILYVPFNDYHSHPVQIEPYRGKVLYSINYYWRSTTPNAPTKLKDDLATVSSSIKQTYFSQQVVVVSMRVHQAQTGTNSTLVRVFKHFLKAFKTALVAVDGHLALKVKGKENSSTGWQSRGQKWKKRSRVKRGENNKPINRLAF